MKKLSLLLALGIMGASTVNAQENSNMMLSNNAKAISPVKGHPIANKSHSQLLSSNNGATRAAKNTTITAFNDWFDYWGQNSNTTTSVAYYFDIYPDSSLYDAVNSAYVFSHGLGMSFDPQDDYYYSSAATTTIDDPRITATMSYSIDSFFVAGKYMRNNPTTTVVDSLIIDLIATNSTVDSGTFKLMFPADANFADMAPDSVARFASALYTTSDNSSTNLKAEAWDSIKVLHKQRYAIALDAAFYDDTDAGGDHDLNFALTTPLTVPAGQKVVSLVQFKSSVAYTAGTPLTSANYYHLFAGDPGGASTWPVQSIGGGLAGSYQTGLIAQNQDAYTGNPNNFTYMGHLMVIPSVAFQTQAPAAVNVPTGTEVPLQAFHVTYDTGSVSGVRNVNSMLSKVSAFPNPATSQLNISFILSQNAAVSVTLTNMLGQVVDTKNIANASNGKVVFNTANLPEGVYVYTVDANGSRATGHVVVAH